MFNDRLFALDRYQSKTNSDIINYRSKNYRKYKNQKNGNFCNALAKRKKSKIPQHMNQKIIIQNYVLT